MSSKIRRLMCPLATASVLALGLAACGGDDADADAGSGATTGASTGAAKLSGTIRVDGSSTVAPLSEAAAELFREENSGVQVTVGTSGTGGGFKKFCAGETDISDASRAIKDEESALCDAKKITHEEIQVANDALTVVVNKENDWAKCLTVPQLKKIWDQGSKVNNWNQVDPKFPNVPIKLFGAGTDSGTFDYFTKEINGEEKRSRSDYNATEDDNVTVTGVSGTKGGLGYFGFSYFEENASKLQAVQIDGGDGCVSPSVEAAQDGSYKPLARPLFIYTSSAALKRPEVTSFIEFYLSNAKDVAEQAKFVPMTEEQTAKAKAAVDTLKKSVAG